MTMQIKVFLIRSSSRTLHLHLDPFLKTQIVACSDDRNLNFLPPVKQHMLAWREEFFIHIKNKFHRSRDN